MRRIWPALLVGAAVAAPHPALAQPGGGRIGPSFGITGNGRQLHPAGRMTAVGDFPTGGALTPDGRFYWAVDAGHGRDDVQIVDVASGAVKQVLPLPGASTGIAFAPDGHAAYVSGEPRGNSHPAGPVQAPNGDAIHVFAVDRTSGRASEQTPIDLPSASGGTAQSHRSTPIPGFAVPPDEPSQTAPAWPQGLAVSPDGERLVVVLEQADQVAIVDLTTRTSRLVRVGAYPYGVAVARDDRTAYVTNEYDGTVSAVDLDSARVRATIDVGGTGAHAEGIVADPGRDRVYVAVTARDQVLAIDSARNRPVWRVSVAAPQGTGAAPVALALDPAGRTLYSADSGEDAVAAISLARRPAQRRAAHRAPAPTRADPWPQREAPARRTPGHAPRSAGAGVRRAVAPPGSRVRQGGARRSRRSRAGHDACARQSAHAARGRLPRAAGARGCGGEAAAAIALPARRDRPPARRTAGRKAADRGVPERGGGHGRWRKARLARREGHGGRAEPGLRHRAREQLEGAVRKLRARHAARPRGRAAAAYRQGGAQDEQGGGRGAAPR